MSTHIDTRRQTAPAWRAGLALYTCLSAVPALAVAAAPPPRPVQSLAPVATALTSAPAGRTRAAAAPADSVALHCSGQAAAPGSLNLALGKSTLMRLPEAVQNRSVGNPAVVQAMLVSPDTLYVAGVDIGSSNMIVQGRSGLCSVIEVVVGIDPAALQAALAQLMPELDQVRVSAAGDTLVLSGSVDDAPAVARVMDLAAAFVRRPAQALATGGNGAAATAGAAAAAGTGALVATSASAATTTPGAALRIINLLNVNGPQQVMLEVKIAEVSKTLLDKMEAGVALKGVGGSWAASLVSNFITGTLKGMLDARKSNGSLLSIDAQKQDGLVRILAEPTVMALSGQEGSFLAGGKIFIPVSQDTNRVTLEEREYGVGLRFTPTVLSGGRIHLRVAPEVSELSRDGIGISATGFNGVAVLPLMTTRRASTTVELFDGQSFAIGGLIKNNQTSNIHALPVLGEVPVLGALFRSTDFQQDRTELLFVVTPHLVKPLPANYALPTDSAPPPSRAGLFLNGRMQSPPDAQLQGAAAAPGAVPPADQK